jgi:hypothetical protein
VEPSRAHVHLISEILPDLVTIGTIGIGSGIDLDLSSVLLLLASAISCCSEADSKGSEKVRR